jgi:hypothetical protein
MVEVNYKLHLSDNNIVLAHQAQHVYYLNYPHRSLKNWWVIYKVYRQMHTHRYNECMESHKDDDVDDVYQEEIEGHKGFTVSDGT